MKDLDDRFGIPDSAFLAAMESHGRNNPSIRLGMYVPTRREVAELPANNLYSILIDWLWECPSELIASDEQIAEVRSILLTRPDSNDPIISKLVAECDEYIAIR